MRFTTLRVNHVLTLLFAGSFTSGALAGTAPGAAITYGPAGGTAVPTASGSVLIALAVLLAVVAVRFMQSRPDSRARLMSLLMATSALAVGTAGVGLVSDAFARPAVFEMTEEDGGVINLPEGFFEVMNATPINQLIKRIEPNPGCFVVDNVNGGIANGGMNGGMNGGGSYQGTCSDSPATELAPEDFCSIEIACDV